MQSTGYGLVRPEKPFGFLLLSLQIALHEPLGLTLLRDPWAYAPQNTVISEVSLRLEECDCGDFIL